MAIVLSQTNTSVATVAGTPDNPVTITSTGLLLDGLYANSLNAAAWTITNAGSVLGAGITLQSVGTVLNSGSVASSGTGVDLLGGGYVGNAGGGMIAGGGGVGGTSFTDTGGDGGDGADGVNLAVTGTLSNSGTIAAGFGGSGGETFGTTADGGAGGSGVDAAPDSALVNSGRVSGGAGGFGVLSSYASNGGTGGSGVNLATGGSMTNTGTISGGDGGGGGNATEALGAHPVGIADPGASGGDGGLGVSLAAGTGLTNTGAIVGGGGGGAGVLERQEFGAAGPAGNGGAGVDLAAGAILTNTGTISGGYGGVGSGSPGGLVGGGGGIGGAGIDLTAGATVTNSGVIVGGIGGAGAGGEEGGGGGPGGWGISLTAGGVVTNSGTIAGGSGGAGGEGIAFGQAPEGYHGGGVYLGAGMLVNAGTIIGGAEAVLFGSLPATLVIEPGAVFVGAVAANSTVADEMRLGGSVAATLSGIGSNYLDFSRIAVDPGASWTLEGGLTGTATLTIGTGGTLDVPGSVSAGQTIGFSGGGVLGIDPDLFNGTIDGFTIGASIDLSGVTDGFSPRIISGNTLEVQRSDHAPVDLKLDPGVIYTGDSYAISPEGVLTQEEAPCFLRGTLIRTERGEVPVELLTTGDRVVTLSGRSRPVTWIGSGRVLVSPGKRCAATPIIVRKGALADNVPHVDLLVTKGHALFVDGVLVPAEFLVNHRSILWDDLRKTVAFYHVELDAHDVLLANGAAAESYRDDGNRWLFQNVNAGWDQPPKPPCAPVLTGGPVVDAIWRRLLDRAGPRPALRLTSDPALHLRVDRQRVDAATRTDDVFVFALRRKLAAVRIVSLAAAPQELGLARDPRCLGVALRRLIVRQGTRFRVIKADDDRLVDGFHTFEDTTGLRWTDGDATLPAALFQGFEAPLELVLQLGGSTHYPTSIGARGRVAA